MYCTCRIVPSMSCPGGGLGCLLAYLPWLPLMRGYVQCVEVVIVSHVHRLIWRYYRGQDEWGNHRSPTASADQTWQALGVFSLRSAISQTAASYLTCLTRFVCWTQPASSEFCSQAAGLSTSAMAPCLCLGKSTLLDSGSTTVPCILVITPAMSQMCIKVIHRYEERHC